MPRRVENRRLRSFQMMKYIIRMILRLTPVEKIIRKTTKVSTIAKVSQAVPITMLKMRSSLK